MERTKYLLVTLLLWAASAMGNTHQSQIYNAYIQGDMAGWEIIIREMEQHKDKTARYMLELVNYQYGYVAWCLGADKNDEAARYLAKAELYLGALEKRKYRPATLQAYRAAFYGFHIGLNAVKAPFVGPKSIAAAQNAIALDNTDPLGYIQYGNIQYYMPSALGGSKTEAIAYYRKAQLRMETLLGNDRKDWNYLQLLLVIAEAHESAGNLTAAKAYYEKLLATEPAFAYIKNERYPQIVRKLQNK